MLRTLPIVLILSGLLYATSTARAQDVPPEANGMPREIPKDQPAMGWSLRNLDPEQQQRMLRLSTFVNGEIPHHYSTTENTVGYTVRAIAEGGALYQANCQKCHGVMGLGNGDLAYSLKPSPALLAYMVQQPVAVDHYLLWSIAEGGEQFGTAMPAFKNRLSQDQIFQIVAYLRAGFPDLEDEPPAGMQGGPGAATTDEPNRMTRDID